MKKIALVLSLVAFMISPQIFAGSGKAVVSGHNSASGSKLKTVFYVSNTTDNDLAVTVTFYKQDGTIVTSTSDVTYVNFFNSDSEIEAGKTGIVTIYPSTWTYGYAVIEWANLGSDDDNYALVAQGFTEVQNSSNVVIDRYSVPVNCGKVF